MLQEIDLCGKTVIADHGYDMNNILELIERQQGVAVIPSRKHRKVQRACDWWLYKERHLVECLFNKLKHYRRLATRYDKLTCTFCGLFVDGFDFAMAKLGLKTHSKWEWEIWNTKN